jgi:ferritin-like metal-binding protein YciE
MELTNLRDLLEHTIQDAYSAETQIIAALPKMVKKASTPELKEAFKTHLAETKEQAKRLEKVGKLLKCEVEGETCLAMKGLIKETEGFMEEDMSTEVSDAGLIMMAQKVEHYEIATYGTAIVYCRHLGENAALALLEETLNEEKNCDVLLTTLAEGHINQDAENVEEGSAMPAKTAKASAKTAPSSAKAPSKASAKK